ncbi:MAG: hypothetical protein PHS41_10155 [Victivallaceae bacterium]|nr:hypothetical protein [Victivallaceae bacterium]
MNNKLTTDPAWNQTLQNGDIDFGGIQSSSDSEVLEFQTNQTAFKDIVVGAGNSLALQSGDTVDKVAITGGSMTIGDGATATGTRLLSGEVSVSPGGVISETTQSGGTLFIAYGGTARDTCVSSGTLRDWSFCCHYLFMIWFK